MVTHTRSSSVSDQLAKRIGAATCFGETAARDERLLQGFHVRFWPAVLRPGDYLRIPAVKLRDLNFDQEVTGHRASGGSMHGILPILATARAHVARLTKAEHPRFLHRASFVSMLVFILIPATLIHAGIASMDNDRKTVSALDKEYQAAVKRNDSATMARILADDFVLVTGSGKTYTKADMLEDAKRGDAYERNDEEVQTVRVWGDTAVVTAKLWERFTSNGKSYDHKLWFSDTYVRTSAGWHYVFGQSSLPLPNKDE